MHLLFNGMRVAHFFVFCVVLCQHMVVVFSSYCKSICRLFFVDLRLLDTPSVSANISSIITYVRKTTKPETYKDLLKQISKYDTY
jgi:hypothetical protein